jgi:hypothetical protein
MKNLIPFFVVLFSVVLIAGCGQSRPPGFPKLYDCALTFQFEDGSPVDGAMVSLSPETAALAQWSIAGGTASSGTVKFYTNGDFAGAPAGKFKVLIRKTEVFESGRSADGYPFNDVRPLLNEKYDNLDSTPFSLEIPDKAVQETFTVEK